MSLLLGSESIGRKSVLQNAGILFDSYATSSEEIHLEGEVTQNEAIDLVIKNSNLKMESLLSSEPKKDYNILITADTVVWFDNKIFGKASDKKTAENFLNIFSGSKHFCISGSTITILDKYVEINRKELYDISEVKITANKELIANYLDNDEWKGKAGAYAIQGKGSILISNIKGNFQNIMGLPLSKILDYLIENNYFSLLKFK